MRAAIEQANDNDNNDEHNSTGVIDTINFDLPAGDPGHLYYVDDGVAGQVSQANVTTTTAADDSIIADIDPDWPHSWWSINPASALPQIWEPVVIDGYTGYLQSPNLGSV